MPSGKHRRVAQQFHPADALQSRRANRFERQPGLRHQSCFDSALGSHEHDLPLSVTAAARLVRRAAAILARRPCRKHVAARAAAGDQQRLHVGRVCIARLTSSSACWLMFKSTPVANSITSKLDPP